MTPLESGFLFAGDCEGVNLAGSFALRLQCGLSSEFVAATAATERAQFVSVGRFVLRGVGRARELFTLDPEVL